MVLGKLPVPGVLLIRIIVGQGPAVFVVGVGGFVYHFSLLSPSLRETARQPTDQQPRAFIYRLFWRAFMVQYGLKQRHSLCFEYKTSCMRMFFSVYMVTHVAWQHVSPCKH